MNIRIKHNALAVAMLAALGTAQAAEGDDLKDYLVDINGGAVGAHEILGLPASVVSAIQTPKDFVAALNTASGDAGKAGFGISFTPARSGFRPMAISIGDYANKSNLFTRLWGGTTFSYYVDTQITEHEYTIPIVNRCTGVLSCVRRNCT